MRNWRPRYMNEGGIASLMSNGGSEAMMLELEGDEGYLPEAQQLQRKAGSQIAESMFDRAMELGVDSSEEAQQIMEEETEGRGFGRVSPELTEMIGEMLMPGAGKEKMGKDVRTHLKQAISKIKKPPKMWYGGAPSYKKGYYGKSYK